MIFTGKLSVTMSGLEQDNFKYHSKKTGEMQQYRFKTYSTLPRQTFE